MKALQWGRLEGAMAVGAAADELLFETCPVPIAEVQ
jgi:hypothetical protein